MDNAAVERRKRHLSEGDESSGQQDARRVRSMLEVDRTAQAPDGQQQEPALAVAVVHPYLSETSRIHRPPSPPESDCSHEEDSDDDSDDDDDDHGDAALAGYEYCSKEAIRYLMEEEKLDADHPVIRQLQQHLDSRRAFASNPGPSKP